MEELTLSTMIAVFEELFGKAVFWSLVGVTVLGAVLFLFVVVRDRGILARRFARAELAAPVGGVLAVAFVWFMTNSGLADVGGPIDVMLLIGVFLAGAGGVTVIGYIIGGLLFPRRRVTAAETPAYAGGDTIFASKVSTAS